MGLSLNLISTNSYSIPSTEPQFLSSKETDFISPYYHFYSSHFNAEIHTLSPSDFILWAQDFSTLIL
jgi:hypothetical protein